MSTLEYESKLRKEINIEKKRLKIQNQYNDEITKNTICPSNPCDLAVNCYAAAYYREQDSKRKTFAKDMAAQNIKC